MSLRIFFSVFLFLSVSALTGQTSNADMLSGTWFLTYNLENTKDSLVFSRDGSARNNWGDRIEFNSSDSFVDAYSAPCGNDTQIHNDVGTWQLSGQTIITSIPLTADGGTKHTIVQLSPDKLVLVKSK